MLRKFELTKKWVELYSTYGITVGNNLTIQNVGLGTVKIAENIAANVITDTLAANEITLKGTFGAIWEVTNSPTSVWVKSKGLTAIIIVEDNDT